MKILIVDDKEENRYLLEALLQGKGHEALSAENGAEALERLRKEGDFGLVISDILMPVMDGFQLTREIRSDKKLESLPLIIYTATYTGPKDEQLALSIGADRFIVKPCEPEAFLKAMDEVMSLHGREETKSSRNKSPAEKEYLKLYNMRLVQKLERKMLEAERELQARHEAERSLRQSERLLKNITENMFDLVVLTDKQGDILHASASHKRLGYDSENLVGRSILELIHPDDHSLCGDRLASLPRSPESEKQECRLKSTDNSYLWVEMVGSVLENGDEKDTTLIFSSRDISERKTAEEEREKFREQFLQAQKMEAIGHLAGGVAHDFNNMLNVILGYADVLLLTAELSEESQEYIGMIKQAGKRSVNLTRQLLTFARKQRVHPEILNLNDAVEGSLKILRRLIGENITLTWKPGVNIRSVTMDPTQVDQILANLAVNARDAISDVGRVAIETTHVGIDKEYCEQYSEAVPGEYVMLAVSDTGSGMNETVLGHLFEPFFTTKGVGEGTGLGLATVYGIVKQNHGFINVYSEPGQGTTFKIYFPCSEETDSEKTEKNEKLLPTGDETLLVVEDEKSMLELSRRLLERLGYKVLTASSAAEALPLCKDYDGEIHLLLTDVVMPKMNGRMLAQKLLRVKPHMKVLFMSGYSGDIIERGAFREKNFQFLPKPFSLQILAEKVRAVLDAK